ncbi:MAG: DUF3575 domain-containing protein [Bacteroidota bacterium]
MRKLNIPKSAAAIVLGAASLLFSSQAAMAQAVQATPVTQPSAESSKRTSEQPNLVKCSIVSPFYKTITVGYERILTDKKSVSINFSYTNVSFDNTQYSGISITPEYRLYLSRKSAAPHGFYMSPFLRYMMLDLNQNYKIWNYFTNKDDEFAAKAKLSSFGAGLTFGKQWIFNDLVTFDIFMGPVWDFNNVKQVSNAGPVDHSVQPTTLLKEYTIRFGANLGFAF